MAENRSVLAVDVGNSRLKWGRFEGDRLERHGTVSEADPGCWDELLNPLPAVVALALTGPDALTAPLQERLAQLADEIEVFEATTDAACAGLVNSYADPGRMGVDRWLAMLGARHRTAGPVCVVDVGTAVTVDIVDEAGRHVGGWILPAVELMRDALASGTRRVGAWAPPSTPEVWGTSTAACVALGCLAAERATVVEAVSAFLAERPSGQVFLTGGGADRVAAAIGTLTASVTIDPALVLRGLAVRATLARTD